MTMHSGEIYYSETKYMATLGYLRVYKNSTKELFSPVHLCPKNSAKALVFGMRLERTAEAPGPCCLVDNVQPSGWNETRNDNFSCTGEFSPTDGKMFLRSFNDAREVGEDFSLHRIHKFVTHFQLDEKDEFSSDESD